MIADLKPYLEMKDSGVPWLLQSDFVVWRSC